MWQILPAIQKQSSATENVKLNNIKAICVRAMALLKDELQFMGQCI